MSDLKRSVKRIVGACCVFSKGISHGSMQKVPGLILVLALTFGTAIPGLSQVVSDFERSRYSPAAYYNYSEAADVTLLVHIWGTVRNPGLYEIPTETTLSHVLSLSGGPIVAPRQRREDRTIQVRLFRKNESERDLVFETMMRNEVFASTTDPVLFPNDIIAVETVTRNRFSWRDAFPVIAAVGTITIVIERLANSR